MGKIASPDAPVSQCKVSAIKLLYANADKADYAMLRLTELAYKCMIVRAAGQLLTPVSVGCAEEIEKTTRAGGKSSRASAAARTRPNVTASHSRATACSAAEGEYLSQASIRAIERGSR